MGVVNIAQTLNDLKYDSPSVYKKKIKIFKESNPNITPLWKPNTIRNILSNQVYIGNLEQKKTSKLNYRSKKVSTVNKNNRIIVPNTHDPIISKFDFETVQYNYSRLGITPRTRKIPHLFSEILVCADCGRKMIRTSKKTKTKTYAYYKCRTYNQISKTACERHSINEDRIKEIVFKHIKSQIYCIADFNKIIQSINGEQIQEIQLKSYERKLRENEKALNNQIVSKIDLFKYCSEKGTLDSEYDLMAQIINDDIKALEKSIIMWKEKISEARKHKIKDVEWLKQYMQYLDVKNLTRSLLLALVEKITIKKDISIKITYRYSNDIMEFKNHIHDKSNLHDIETGVM